MVKTLKEMSKSMTNFPLFVAKKGKYYLALEGNLVIGTTRQDKAIAFKKEEELIKFLDICAVDTKNRKILGDSYKTVQLGLSGG